MRNFIPISRPSITDIEITFLNNAIKSGWVSSIGEYINRFEDDFANFCGTKYALTTSNGTVALHLALVALNIKVDDEVIIPDFSFIATANAVSYTGAKVIFCDIDKDTLCLNEKQLKSLITSKTKAIIPVHIYGMPSNMQEITKIAREHGIYVIEDAAEAHGAEINGQKVGSFGDCGVFSFYGNKIITTGEGGMVTTDNIEIYNKMKKLRDHAMSPEKRYWHDEIGYNYRMTNIQAALGYAQLTRIEEIISRKIEIYKRYAENMKSVNGVLLRNTTNANVKSVYWMICIEIIKCDEQTRDLIMNSLGEKGIDSRPYFYPISDMPMYSSAHTPNTHEISTRGLNLPTYFDIKDEEIDYVCDELKLIVAELQCG